MRYSTKQEKSRSYGIFGNKQQIRKIANNIARIAFQMPSSFTLTQFQPKLFSAIIGFEIPCSLTLRPLLLPALCRLPRPLLAVGELCPLPPDMKYPPIPPPADVWLISPAVGTELARWWFCRFLR